MATHDYVIANASGAAVRADLNNALAAIVSNNSNATEPATTYPYMWWRDTTTGLLKVRNAANDGWVQSVLLDDSGRLLVGTSSAFDSGANALIQASTSGDTRIDLERANASIAADDVLGEIRFYASDTTNASDYCAGIQAVADNTQSNNDRPTRLVFSTTADGASSPTEHVRIDEAGSLFVGNGTTGTIGTQASSTNLGIFSVDVSTAAAGAFLRLSRDTGAANAIAQFWGSSGLAIIKGDGDLENTNNRYTGISDVKFKQNIEDASSQWEDIKAIQVRKYELIAHPERKHIGVVAQELEQVCPGLVIERQDEDTKEPYKSVAYSVLYMKAVKALQEAMERIEQLETSKADLLARVTALESA